MQDRRLGTHVRIVSRRTDKARSAPVSRTHGRRGSGLSTVRDVVGASAPDAREVGCMTKPTYTARGPEDLLAMIPFLLGFHPEDSVVLMTFGPPNSFHARVDLPVAMDDQHAVRDLLMQAVVSNAVRRVALVVYSEDAGATDSQCRLLVEALLDVDIEIIDVLRADGERYFVFGDDDPGTPYDLTSHRFTAERVFDGQVVHRSRAELVDTLIGVDEEDATEVALAADRFADTLLGPDGSRAPEEALVELRGHARWLQRRIRELLRDPQPLPATDAGRMLVLTSVVLTRDVAWSEMTRENSARQVCLWRELVRRAPRDLLPGVSSLLAFAAWLAGDGALSWCALDRALEVDPDYSMAHRVAEALSCAFHPSSWSPVPEAELPIFDDSWRARQAS
jgi:hypothetical protein